MRTATVLCRVALVLAAPVAVRAQVVSFVPVDALFVRLTLERPVHPTELDFSTAIAQAAVGLPVRPRIRVVGGISVAHTRQRSRPSSTVLSNAFVEALFGGEGGFGSLRITFPTSGRLVNTEAYAADAALAADLERPERFTPRVVAVSFALNRRWRIGPTGVAGGRLGVAAVAPAGFRQEVYGRYGLFGEATWSEIRMGGELGGATFLNSLVGGSVGERSVHMLTLYAGLESAFLSPTLFVRLPLEEDTRSAIRALFGLRLTR